MNKITRAVKETANYGNWILRVVTDTNNNLWFNLQDICKCIGINDPHGLKRRLPHNYRLFKPSDFLDSGAIYIKEFHKKIGISQKGETFLSRQNLGVIFKSGALDIKVRDFEKWVVNEVIRRINSYGTGVTYSSESVNYHQPTDLGKACCPKISARKVNQILKTMGYQIKCKRGWEAIGEGLYNSKVNKLSSYDYNLLWNLDFFITAYKHYLEQFGV